MANKKISDGVGKKIVEALKKQSEIEINPISTHGSSGDLESVTDAISACFGNSASDIEDVFQESNFSGENSIENYSYDLDPGEDSLESKDFAPNVEKKAAHKPFEAYPHPKAAVSDNFINELDSFEIPSNIAVLKKLITQLPSGVTRHTGAQIIKQTMEALGISMKSVLQEAQQVQEGLNNSAKECYATVQEYKRQILGLEKQAQSHQKQYAALNELISLFIQTGV